MSKTEDKSPVSEAELQAIIQSQQGKIEHLQQQMDRMTELLLIAQRARFDTLAKKPSMLLPIKLHTLTRRKIPKIIRHPNPLRITLLSANTSARPNEPLRN